MKKLLLFIIMAIALMGIANATVYYNEQFSNSSICSALSFTKADTSGGAGSESHSCSVTSGILNLNLKNSAVEGFDYNTKIEQPEDFWNRDMTYTMIFKKSNSFTDLYLMPFISQSNVYYANHNGFNCGAGITNINYTIPNSLVKSTSEITTKGTLLNDNRTTFTNPIKFNYPNNQIDMFGTMANLEYGQSGCKQDSYSLTYYNNTAQSYCVDNFCVMQVFWNGTGDKYLRYYFNGNLVGFIPYSTQASYQYSPFIVGISGSNYGGSLINMSESFLFSGSDEVTVNIDRITFEEGNKIGFYGFTGGGVTECSDSIDNDLDGLTDFPEDPSCTSALGNTESPKDASNCVEPASCSQAEKCMYVTDFYCLTDPIYFHGWTTNSSYFGQLMKEQSYFGVSTILLNEYNNPDVSTMLPNGSFVTLPSSFSLYHNFSSSNKLDYTNAEHKLTFYFDNVNNYNYFGDDQWVNISLIGGTTNVPAMTLGLRPISNTPTTTLLMMYVNGVNVKNATVYEGGAWKFEILIDTYKAINYISYPTFDFFYRTQSVVPSVNPSGDWSYSGQKWNLNSASDTYTKAIRLNVSGRPAQDGYINDAPIYMYLDYIHSYGMFDETETPTQCTTWTGDINPYFFKEYFDGCLNNCGWMTIPNPLCTYGVLQGTKSDSITLTKSSTLLTSTLTNYWTFAFDITPQDYDTGGAVGLQLYDSDGKNLVYLLLSEGNLYNRVDGQYEVLYAPPQDMNTNIELLFDFSKDTFELWIDRVKISSGNRLADSLYDYNDVAKVSIMSIAYSFLLDNVFIFTSTQDNQYIIVNPNTNPSVRVSNTTKYCGHLYTSQPACDKDSDCATDYCLPNKICSSFDMKYCDLKEYERGSNMCLASAMVSCGVESTGKIILNNFFSTLIIILLLVGATYLSVMFNRKR